MLEHGQMHRKVTATGQISTRRSRALTATLLLLPPALFGARLLFVIAHWPAYRQEPRRMWRASEGGAAMYGGLLVAVPLKCSKQGGERPSSAARS